MIIVARLPIIHRTEKVRELIGNIKEGGIVYVSSFFYSGKTILLDQLCEIWDGPILRFNSRKDDWTAFKESIAEAKDFLLVIDNVDNLSESISEELSEMLSSLPERQHAVLAGRAQLPAKLDKQCLIGNIVVMGRDYVMFDEEEIIQLFLEYGIELVPAEVRMILDRLWGWPYGLHILAQKILRHDNESFHLLIDETRLEIRRVVVSDVFRTFPEYERQFLYDLALFESLSGDLARTLTGRNDAPQIMEDIAKKSYMLLQGRERRFVFIPIVRQALYDEMRNLYNMDYIHGQYKKAALYYEKEGEIPKAISCYKQLGDVDKIIELLIGAAYNRPADGNCVNLREGYSLLTKETILTHPELIKGKCEIESLLGHAEQSAGWYNELERFIRRTDSSDVQHKTAEEMKAYLDLSLSWFGTGHILKKLLAAAKNPGLRSSVLWKNGFNVAGNSTSLMNGGLDFCRWVPHGRNIYRLFRIPVETALGPGGRGVADIAIAEYELETNLDGDYSAAMTKIREGIQRVTDNPEMYYAAVGIQGRIEAARGNAEEAIHMMDNAIRSLPEQHPKRLEKNLIVFRHWLMLLQGEVYAARNWAETEAPDETGEFIILDRYSYMLKLRMYIILGKRKKIPFLTTILRQYFTSYDRPYMLIRLNLLEAVDHYRNGEKAWRDRMAEALKLAKQYSLARVIADEGMAIIDMLNEMELSDEPWERGVLELTRRQAANYPGYMKQMAVKPAFTDREYQVYSLLIAGYKNAKIASILNIKERTVKHFCRLIYQKLGVTTRAEAINRAAELGDIR